MNIDAYCIGTKVFVADQYFAENKETKGFGFYEAIIDSIVVSTKNHQQLIRYWLKTPSGDDWGDTVDSFYVDIDFIKLAWKIKKEVWDKVDDYK